MRARALQAASGAWAQAALEVRRGQLTLVTHGQAVSLGPPHVSAAQAAWDRGWVLEGCLSCLHFDLERGQCHLVPGDAGRAEGRGCGEHVPGQRGLTAAQLAAARQHLRVLSPRPSRTEPFQAALWGLVQGATPQQQAECARVLAWCAGGAPVGVQTGALWGVGLGLQPGTDEAVLARAWALAPGRQAGCAAAAALAVRLALQKATAEAMLARLREACAPRSPGLRVCLGQAQASFDEVLSAKAAGQASWSAEKQVVDAVALFGLAPECPAQLERSARQATYGPAVLPLALALSGAHNGGEGLVDADVQVRQLGHALWVAWGAR
jgi:hypothetical protein